jgi:rod shape-determining protein MreB
MQIFSLRKGNSFAIDLGNSNTILSKVDSSLSHPSLVVLNKNDNTIKAVGKEAFDMLGKVQDNLKVIKPLKEGLIADFNSTRDMLKALVGSAYPKNSLLSGFDCIIAGVPYASTEVERRALRDSLEQFNSSKTYLIFEPIAAAIGMGLDISQPDGKFIVDIGGGITEAVVLSLSGIVNHRSIKTGGDTFDDDIQKHVKREYNIDIGINMAEQVKIHVGVAMEAIQDPPAPISVVGKDAVNGIPREIQLGPSEIAYALDTSIIKIEQAILQTLEECPPELAGDIYSNGIHLTGGASLLRGFRERISTKVKLSVHQDQEALGSVSKGMTVILKDPAKYRGVLFK